MIAYQVMPRALFKSEKPVRDRRYLAFVRRFPCVGCTSTRGVQACHTGPHGISQKASDLKALPFCVKCHPLFDRDPAGFAELRGLDVVALIAMFNRFYAAKVGQA